MKHHKGKKKEEIQKTKLPKHVERFFFLKKKFANKETGKEREIFFFKKKQRREISILLLKVAYSEKHKKRKVNDKGAKDSLEKKHTK